MAIEAPYYRRHLEDKNYTKLLAIPGRIAQASEFTDMQDILSSHIKSIGNSIMVDGNIVSGCQAVFSEEGDEKYVTITDGKIYLDGVVRDFSESTIAITGEGTETVNVILEETIITEEEDRDLYDPSIIGSYSQEGCHAIQYKLKLALNKEGYPILYTLSNGTLATLQKATNEYANIVEIMARRTYDESGNYRVSGLEIRERGLYDSKRIYMTCTAGKAYVRGFEISVPADLIFSVRKPLDVSDATNIFNYSSSNTFTLTSTPVAAIKNVSAGFQVTATLSRSSTASYDVIDIDTTHTVSAIVSIVSDSTTYKLSTDYKLSGNTVEWLSSGSSPSSGTSYTITYRYNDSLETNEYTYTKSGTFTYTGSRAFYSGNVISVEYDYYLSRQDLISINSDGEIVVTEGEPNLSAMCYYPKVYDPNSLILGVVALEAGDNTPTITNKSIDVVNMESLNKLYNRIVTLEYNQAVSDLDNEATEGEAASELQGVFTDGFIGTTKLDTGASDLDCCIDDENGYLTTSFDAQTYDLSLSSGTYQIMGNAYVAPYTQEVVLSQPLATTSILVNPYAVFDPLCPLQLSPAVDNWVDNSSITIINPTKTITQSVSTSTTRSWYARYSTTTLKTFFGDLSTAVITSGSINSSSATWTQNSSTSTTTSENTKIAYMRIRKVSFECVGFTPYADNIYLQFDHSNISVLPSGTTTVGTKSGTLKADATGKVAGYFTIPQNTTCGTKEVTIYYDGDTTTKLGAKSGSATYTANGTLHTVTTSITPVTKIFTVVDPLAESFGFSEERFITSVDLYFSYYDAEYPVCVQIRNMENGYPGTECYGECVRTTGNASSNGNTATNFSFNNPIRCLADTQYCIVVMTDSTKTACWSAKLAEKRIDTKVTVTANPYTAGVMFTSSNNLTWTAEQDSDLKFRIQAAKFQSSAEVVYASQALSDKSVAPKSMSSFVLAADYIIPSSCSLTWWYNTNTMSSNDWKQCDIFDEIELDSVATSVQFKAVIKATSTASPLISVDCANWTPLLNRTTATYISRNLDVTDGFNTLKVYLDELKNGTSTYKVYYSIDKGSNWVLLDDSSATSGTGLTNYTRYVWNKSITGKQLKMKIVLSTSNALKLPKAKRLMCIFKDV